MGYGRVTAPSTVTERGAAIFLKKLIQKTNRFERAPSSGEIAELISLYIYYYTKGRQL